VETFDVTFNSGILWFSITLFVALLIVSFVGIFRIGNLRMKAALFFTALLCSIAALALAFIFDPFGQIKVIDNWGILDAFDTLLQELEDGLKDAEDTQYEFDSEVELKLAPIFQQGPCGSCWAYASALVLNTMMLKDGRPLQYSCITEEGAVQDAVVSPQSIIELSSSKCSGDYMFRGFEIAQRFTLPTTFCVPGYSSKYPNCPSCQPPGAYTSECYIDTDALPSNNPLPKYSLCADGSPAEYFSVPLCSSSTCYKRLFKEDEIKAWLSSTGPVICYIMAQLENGEAAAWTQYQNINKGGLGWIAQPSKYNQVGARPSPAGGHAMVIYGYGENVNGVKFWHVANSWGKNWSINGTVKIERGVNAWGIETAVYGMNLNLP
jgi:hypothetical protein